MNIPRVVKWISGGASLDGGLETAGLGSGMVQTGEVGELELWSGLAGIIGRARYVVLPERGGNDVGVRRICKHGSTRQQANLKPWSIHHIFKGLPG
jgi:hypothetical protein